MENRVSLDINKAEIVKDRGDNLKKVIKPKGGKKDVEITKDLVKDRGDSLLKSAKENVIYPKNTKLNETLNKNFKKTSEDLVSDGGNKVITKNATHTQAVRSKHFGKTVPIKSQNSRQNEPASKNSDKSAPALMTDRHSMSKAVKETVLPQNNKHYGVISRSLSKSVPRNSKQNEGKIKNTNESAPVEVIIDKDFISKTKDESILKDTQHNAVTSKKNERKIKNSNESTLEGKTIKRDSVTKLAKDNVILKNTKPDKAIETNCFVETAPVDTVPKNNRQNEPISKNYEKPVLVVRKNIVENEKHMNRLLDIDEKKRIRERYTFKGKAVDRNKILDDKSKAKDSHAEDNNDISKKRNNEAENKEKIKENRIYDSTKFDKAQDSTEKSQKRPVIKTIIAKNDASKVYKAVTFAEQKKKSNTPLQIKIPALLKNTNKPDDAVTGNTKLAKVVPNNVENFRRNTINQNVSLSNEENLTKKPKISQSSDNQLMDRSKITKSLQNNNEILMKNINKTKIPLIYEDNLTRNMKDPKMISNNDKLWRNTKIPTITVMRNTKVSNNNNLTKNTKIPKVYNNGDNLKRNTKSQSNKSESITGTKTKISKKEKKKLLESNLSHPSLIKGRKSPVTEVAKWAPNCINKHTRPYYEAWVDTTLTAVTRNTVKDKLYYEKQQLIESFKKIMDQRPETPELVYENYLDEQYTGKIKIHHKQ